MIIRTSFEDLTVRTSDDRELENMALAAELARQVCHDVSNFVYNLFLQIEIAQTKPEALKGPSWDGVKCEASRLVATLREWDRYHDRFSNSEAKVDLHEVLQSVCADVTAHGQSLALGAGISQKPLPVHSAATAARHLLRLLIEDAASRCQAPSAGPIVAIETAQTTTKALVRIRALAPLAEAGTKDCAVIKEDQPTSLMAAACRSLAIRLDVTIHWERCADGRPKIQVEFPLALDN